MPADPLTLRHLCFPVALSQGRRYPELSHPYRNEFERDRDRVVHAKAFRRLEDKTQVFAPGLSDHFRNRLTHTFEVSQLARTVARVLELDEDFTEALALAHDIGHPPFAHAGEEELDRQMQVFGDHFEHNLHALRLVERFEQAYARFPGLNLTFEVREGIVKHSRDFAPGELPELDEFLPGLRPPLEAQLIDLADEIAYNTADLDDAYGAQLFSLDDVTQAVPLVAELWDTITHHYPGSPERIQFRETVRALLNWLVTGLIEGTYQSAEAAGVSTVQSVREHPQRLAAFRPDAKETSLRLKRFLRSCVYYSAELVAERQRSAAQIGELFQYYLADLRRLPGVYQEQCEEDPAHRVICDYIAGMTDGYFRRTYHQAMS